MRLDALTAALDVVSLVGDPARVEVSSLAYDSRRAGPGAMFCCLPGRHSDGHLHAGDALARGAVALLCERPLDLPVAQVVVGDARAQMGRAASAFWGHPARRLQVVGVTGTNGKTTTTWLLRSVLEAAGRRTGVIGTLGGPRTTPESTDLQETLAGLAGGGCACVAMEVSSHALALSRVEGTDFAVAVFTNLGRDHLDFHQSMEEYFAVKARLFQPERAAAAVVNVDDPHGRLLLETAQIPTRPFSLDDVSDLDIGLHRSTCTWRGRRLQVPLGGAANLSNALAAATVALELGVGADVVVEGLAASPPIPGRYQTVKRGQPFTVVVDYAHTPDALEQLLVAARPASAGGRVAVVFGCGGDRDRDKRPLMGRVAANLADLAVVTTDNPRDEDPGRIIAEVTVGATGPGQVVVEPDRRAAIRLVLSGATAGDVVLVAGKGHEKSQLVGGRTFDFDDARVVEEELDGLGLSSGGQP
ncbi:MAG: UDP-N-acetylmuramoyl-L-alanyl-D-glutamate--2,6-diaminopimelate ligase [Acidimicrobiales bacterium]